MSRGSRHLSFGACSNARSAATSDYGAPDPFRERRPTPGAIDLPRTRSSGLDAELPHLLHRAAEAECTLLLIHDADAEDAIRYYASLILSFQRSAWVFRRDGDLEGLQVDAAVVKNRLAPPGLTARWIIPYPIP